MEHSMSFRHQLRVRYGECDQQGVVFNANYMAYVDDATEVWISSVAPGGDYHGLGWDWMVVRSVIEWQGPARNGETIDIEVAIVRYGSSSFDLGFVGTVGTRAVFKARTVCVSVTPVTLDKIATPARVRELLGPAEPWDVPV
jgi:acyl-CoA thioester hydrolase